MGASALRALEKGSYDAALLDLRMPGMTGIEVLGKIRQLNPRHPGHHPDGYATVDTAVQALRLGAFDYLTKPCNGPRLEVILSRVSERARPRRTRPPRRDPAEECRRRTDPDRRHPLRCSRSAA